MAVSNSRNRSTGKARIRLLDKTEYPGAAGGEKEKVEGIEMEKKT